MAPEILRKEDESHPWVITGKKTEKKGDSPPA